MTDFVLLSTTTDSLAEAQKIATTLVESKLAACVQVVPQVLSVYRWQGKVEQASEWLCLIKTRRSLVAQVEAEICRLHSYTCPEITTVAIESTSSAYGQWLHEQTGG